MKLAGFGIWLTDLQLILIIAIIVLALGAAVLYWPALVMGAIVFAALTWGLMEACGVRIHVDLHKDPEDDTWQ